MEKKIQRPNIVVFSLDGINVGYLGCYGNTSVATAGLDRLAQDSILFDQYYSNSLDTGSIYRSFWHGISPASFSGETDPIDERASLPARLAAEGYRTILLTDDSRVSSDSPVDDFDEVIEFESVEASFPVASLESSRFFRYFEEMIAVISENVSEESDEPLFLWCRFRGFFLTWDFPDFARQEEWEDDEDPEPYSETTVPFWDGIEDRIRSGQPSDEFDHDAILPYVETWKAGLSLLDIAMDHFLDFMAETGLDRTTAFVLTSERGFPLGEHGRVGVATSERESIFPSLLYCEDWHRPLMIRLPGMDEVSLRTSLLCDPTDLYAILLAVGTSESYGPLIQAVLNEEETYHSHLLLVECDGRSANRCVVTPQWLLRQTTFTFRTGKTPNGMWHGCPVYYEVYALPEDRFNVNEVSGRTADELESLIPLLEGDS